MAYLRWGGSEWYVYRCAREGDTMRSLARKLNIGGEEPRWAQQLDINYSLRDGGLFNYRQLKDIVTRNAWDELPGVDNVDDELHYWDLKGAVLEFIRDVELDYPAPDDYKPRIFTWHQLDNEAMAQMADAIIEGDIDRAAGIYGVYCPLLGWRQSGQDNPHEAGRMAVVRKLVEQAGVPWIRRQYYNPDKPPMEKMLLRYWGDDPE